MARWAAAWAAIELKEVVKTFGPIKAVNGLDLDVPKGICLGLLGPNGAGKSTTMRLLTGQAIADSGTLRVLDYEPPGESKEARADMGVVPQRTTSTSTSRSRTTCASSRVSTVSPTSVPPLIARSASRGCGTVAAMPSTSSPWNAEAPAGRARPRP